jgi:membrane peptidoglycan carboxypeptidase
VELAGAYADFANGGTHVAPHLIRSITDANGREIFKEKAVRLNALDPKVANTVAYALTQVVQKGTGQRAQLGNRPVGGKTGTTENHVDAWFSGFTRQIATTVWMGYPQGGRTMEHVRGIAVTGGSFPAMIWKAFMEKAVEGMPVEGFGKPNFGGETLGATPVPTSTTSPSATPSAIPSIMPSKTPEPNPSPTNTGKPKPSPSPSPTGTATAGATPPP